MIGRGQSNRLMSLMVNGQVKSTLEARKYVLRKGKRKGLSDIMKYTKSSFIAAVYVETVP